MTRSKAYNAAAEKVDQDRVYTPLEAVRLARETSTTKYDATVEVWSRTTEDVKKTIQDQLSAYGSVYTMAVSGAKGNISQITQMAGMRGLMTDPSGRVIDLPIRSSFREVRRVLEYVISTAGCRRGRGRRWTCRGRSRCSTRWR